MSICHFEQNLTVQFPSPTFKIVNHDDNSLYYNQAGSSFKF